MGRDPPWIRLLRACPTWLGVLRNVVLPLGSNFNLFKLILPNRGAGSGVYREPQPHQGSAERISKRNLSQAVPDAQEN